MSWVVENIQWIMLVSGALTIPVAEIVVRNWGALIGLVGAMLIYGAFDPPGRPLICSRAS